MKTGLARAGRTQVDHLPQLQGELGVPGGGPGQPLFLSLSIFCLMRQCNKNSRLTSKITFPRHNTIIFFPIHYTPPPLPEGLDL